MAANFGVLGCQRGGLLFFIVLMTRFLSVFLPGFFLAVPWVSAAGADAMPALLDFRDVIREAREEVFPAVVYIKCRREALERGRRATAEAAGSGVIISESGLVLSNWHVVDKAIEVRCLLSDGRAFNATVLGTDQTTDLALLQLELPDETALLPYARLGDSTRLNEGDFVMAMGAPWGMNRSVSLGIIACADRYLPGSSEYSLWLQTDASISPGNSGGPLVNTEGEIVGINTLAILIGGDLGFAVPSETIAALLPRMKERGEVEWTWTGLQLQPLRDFDRNTYFDADAGVIVAETDADSPAQLAGLRGGDRIVSVNGEPVTALTAEDLPAIRRHLGLLPQEEPIVFEVVRGEDYRTVEVQPREKGRVEGDQIALPRWDMTVKAINQFATPDLYFHRREGVFLYGVRRPGNAMASGFQMRDVILEIDGRPISSIDEVKEIHTRAIESLHERPRMRFTVLRNGVRRQIVLDFSRDYDR